MHDRQRLGPRPGGTLIVTPTTGSLGTNEVVCFASGNAPAMTSGIVAPYIVVQAGGGSTAADFGAISSNNLTAYSGYCDPRHRHHDFHAAFTWRPAASRSGKATRYTP